jgi:DNA-binding transcriptional LysR family regulator
VRQNIFCVLRQNIDALLEESLGAKLFERDHRGIRLTPAGLQFLPCLSDAFDTIERGFRQLTTTKGRRRLVVAVPPTFATQWFSPRLGSLGDEMPDVELSVRTSPTEDCHCNIRFGRDALGGAHSELLMTERHVLVGAPRLFVSAGVKMTLWRCGRKLGLPGGSSCTRTKTACERFGFI